VHSAVIGRLPPRSVRIASYTTALLLVGLMVASQWRSFERRPTYATRYSLQLADAAYEMQKEQNQLKAELADLRARLEALRAASGDLGGEAAELKREIEALSAQGGLVALSGPGLTVTLDDAKLPANAPDIARAIVHSEDITDVFNTAWKSGAEAIAMNGERITGASACVGAVIQINGTLMSPPYVFTIIGSPDQLFATFGAPDELSELKERSRMYGLGFDVVRASELRVPAYTGPLATRYAQVR